MGLDLSTALAPGVQVAVRRLCHCPDVVDRRRFARLAGSYDPAIDQEHKNLRGVLVEPIPDHVGTMRRWVVSMYEAPVCHSTHELEWSWTRQAQTGVTGHNEIRAFEHNLTVLDAVTLLGELA